MKIDEVDIKVKTNIVEETEKAQKLVNLLKEANSLIKSLKDIEITDLDT